MKASEYLGSKKSNGCLLEQKRRYKVITRGGVDVYILKSKRINKHLRKVRTERAINQARECFVGFVTALAKIKNHIENAFDFEVPKQR